MSVNCTFALYKYIWLIYLWRKYKIKLELWSQYNREKFRCFYICFCVLLILFFRHSKFRHVWQFNSNLLFSIALKVTFYFFRSKTNYNVKKRTSRRRKENMKCNCGEEISFADVEGFKNSVYHFIRVHKVPKKIGKKFYEKNGQNQKGKAEKRRHIVQWPKVYVNWCFY